MTAELRTRLALVVLAAVLLVVGVVAVVGGGGPGASAAPAPPHDPPSVRGTVTALDGDRWRIRTDAGEDVTVDLDPTTTYGSRRTPATRAQFAVGSPVAVVGELAGGTVRAERVLLPRQPSGASAAPAPAVLAVPAPAPATCATTAAVQAAVAAATTDGGTAAAAVYDTATGATARAGDAALVNSASVVKVLLATELLLTGQMSGDTDELARAMISTSDDEAADELYELAGGDEVVDLVGAHYGITDLGSPPTEAGQWGATGLHLTALVALYASLHADPVVWPWLSAAMAGTTAVAADGTDQLFGLPAAATTPWSVKQGWMVGIGPGTTYLSTGVLDGRWAVALEATADEDRYGEQMAGTVTAMARALLPAGTVPAGACP